MPELELAAIANSDLIQQSSTIMLIEVILPCLDLKRNIPSELLLYISSRPSSLVLEGVESSLS